MIEININEAKAKLSEYIAAVESGEAVTICRRNVPIARIVPIVQARTEPRPIGLACDAGTALPDGFFEPLPTDLLAAFQGQTPDALLDVPSYPLAAEPPASGGWRK